MRFFKQIPIDIKTTLKLKFLSISTSPVYCKKILVTEKNATKQSKNLIKTRKAGKAKEEKRTIMRQIQ
jgi:hypothetical protein